MPGNQRHGTTGVRPRVRRGVVELVAAPLAAGALLGGLVVAGVKVHGPWAWAVAAVMASPAVAAQIRHAVRGNNGVPAAVATMVAGTVVAGSAGWLASWAAAVTVGVAWVALHDVAVMDQIVSVVIIGSAALGATAKTWRWLGNNDEPSVS